MTWEDNCIYDSDSIEGNMPRDLFLPEWLREKREIIFPHEAVEKIHQLGSGQYGAVFKGKLLQGKAMYVF